VSDGELLLKSRHIMLKLTSVALLAVLSLSPPQSREAEIEALKREIAALRAEQASMQRDLQAIKALLQAITQPRAPEVPGLVGASIPVAGEPTLGSADAKVMIVEVSDYHCPFCRRNIQQTFPQLNQEYIKSGKAAYAFVDYPIAELHPDAAKSHEAAACAADQGRFWEMHTALFAAPPVKDVPSLTGKATALGLDVQAFTACLTGGKHSAAIQESVARMQRLGIGGTPMTVIGIRPAPGQPMKIEQYVYGAQPYEKFKEAIDAVMNTAR
jgi:protein-disulfide isomerase